ncbi:MAG: ATP-binding protein [Myxococcota bacterium]
MNTNLPERAFRWIDGFLPPDLSGAEPDRLSQARITVIACTLSALIQGATSVVMTLQGQWPVAIGNGAAMACSAALLFLLSAGVSLTFVANALVLGLMLFVAGIAGGSGGDANAALHTVAVIPAVSVLLSGWRVGLGWLGVACAFTAGLWWLRASGVAFPIQLDPTTTATAKFPGVIALTLGTAGVVLLSEWVKKRALRDLAAAQQQALENERARRRLEEAMTESQSLESLGVLAGGVAHDFNNLLTGILGNASMLPGDSPEDTATLAEEIALSAEQARDLTDQLMTYAGRSRSVRGAVSVSALVRDVDSLARTALPADVSLRFHLSDAPSTVIADAGQLRQVVLNLITNAGAAIDRFGTVTVRTGREEAAPGGVIPDIALAGPIVFLEVEDDGSGMDEDLTSRIFDPFFTTKPAGRGLGLSAVLGIVRSHGGNIHVYTESGRGTRIRVSVPFVDAEPAQTEAKKRLHLAVEMAGAALVVDDEESVRRFAGRALRELGLDVHEARDGHEALTRIEALRDLRVVLLDARMPGLSGEEVLAELRKKRPELPVVLSTGNAQGFAQADLGPDQVLWLPKPYRAAALQQAAIRAIARPEQEADET